MSSPRWIAARLVPVGLLVVVAGAGAWSLARGAHAQASAAEMTAAEGNEAIGTAMKQMNDAMKVLGKGVTAETKDAALAELSKFETAVIAAKAAVPASAAKVDEKKRAAYVADFRKTLIEALKFAGDAESAVVDGKFKDADTLIRNKLGGLKSSGHGKFKEEGGK
jgi:hypothetical protein